MNNEKENGNIKRYLKRLHGRIKINMLCLNDSMMYIITKGEIGPKKNPKSFYQTMNIHELLDLDEGAYEERVSHILSPNGRIR